MVMMMVLVVTAFVIVVIMMMLVVTAFVIVVIVMVLVLCGLFCQFFELGGKRVLALDGGKEFLSGEFFPIRRDDGHVRVLSEQFDRLGDLLRVSRVRKNDTARIFHLIEEKFAEILEIHLALIRIDDSAEGVKLRALYACALNGADDVRELADARGFDDDAVGRVLRRDLAQGLCKVAHQRTANAPRVHLGDLDAGILQKSAVNADLAEFVFNEHDLLTLVRFLDELSDERRLACAQKS